jgi:DNA modification methylase
MRSLALINWTIQKRKIKDLKPHPKNPRKLSKHDTDHLEKSLSKFGLIDKPIITTDNMIIGGHQRIAVLKKMGHKEVDCFVPDVDIVESDLNELNIRLNRNAGEWDYDILANQWEIKDLIDYGFTNEELDFQDPEQVDAKDDDFEVELPPDPFTKFGDVYELGDHRVICGSAAHYGDIDKVLRGEKIDLVLTDPPYNVSYDGKKTERHKKRDEIENDDLCDKDFELLLKDFYMNAFVFMKEGAGIYVFHADSEGERFRRYFREANLKLSQCLIWLKNSMVLGRQDFHWQHEPVLFGGKEYTDHDPVLYGWKEGEAHKWYNNRKQVTLLKFDRPTRSKEHPTMKPIPMLGYLVSNSTVRNDLVFDFFLGSGSTLLACEQLGRRCFGSELDPSYCDVIVKRWIRFRKEKNLTFNILRNGEACSDFNN